MVDVRAEFLPWLHGIDHAVRLVVTFTQVMLMSLILLLMNGERILLAVCRLVWVSTSIPQDLFPVNISEAEICGREVIKLSPTALDHASTFPGFIRSKHSSSYNWLWLRAHAVMAGHQFLYLCHFGSF